MTSFTQLLGADTPEFLAINGLQFLIVVILGAICGLVLGYEREKKEKPAGLRTIMLITIGSSVFMMMSRFLAQDTFDPGRVAAQIVTGVGFIGGGAIFKSEGWVQGVTTAATIWVAAALGMLIGSGHYVLAIILTIATYGILVYTPVFESLISKKPKYETIRVYLTPEGSQKGWVYLKEMFKRNNGLVDWSPKKDFMLVQIPVAQNASRHLLIECTQSYFVEKIEFLETQKI